jgi:sugar phosphate isomerase/epimerase
MRVSCCAYSYRQYLTSGEMSLFQFLETARQIGCAGVELTSYYFPSTDRAFLNQVKRAAHKEGLSISGTAIGTDFAQPDDEKRQAHIQMAHYWIDNSVILGAPTMRVFAGGVREGDTEEQAFDRVVECLKPCADYAAERGVLLALENHGGITSTAEQILKLCRAVDNEWLGLNLDFGNFSGEDVYSQFEACAPYAVATHAKSHYKGSAGRDMVDYSQVKYIMEAAGYRGFIAIEYEEAEDPKTAVPRFAKELCEIFHK